MAYSQRYKFAGQLRRLMQARPDEGVADRHLLDAFAAGGDEAAFAALVERHGPMVLRVCRRVLRDPDRADDAFQATFLVLARKAASVGRRGSLACWLYGVAVRVALHARADDTRRRRRGAGTAAAAPPDPALEVARRELAAVLDEELAGLPERLRVPLLLCCLEGRTRDEAARQLGWSLGTLKRRLERGRRLLRVRLERRGWAFSAALAGPAVSPPDTSAAVPAGLAEATTRIAQSFLTGGPAAVPPRVDSLAAGALLPRSQVVATLLLVAGLTLAGAGILAWRGAEGPDAAPAETAPVAARRDAHGDPLPPGALARLGTVRFRHGDQVFAVAFSPDGKTLLSAGEDHRVCFWDVATGRRRGQLADHRGGVADAFFSADGKYLVTAAWDDPKQYKTAIRVREAATGRPLREFTSDGRFWQGSVALSPDGRTLAGSDGFNRVRLWDVTTGQSRLLQCGGVEDYTSNVAFTPDGKTLATAGGKVIRLWDVATGARTEELPVPGAVRGLACAPDGKVLAAACEGPVRLFRPGTGQEPTVLGPPTSRAWAVAFAPDGKTLVSGEMGGEVVLWDVGTGKAVRQLPGKDSGRVWSVAFSPDGRLVAVGHEGSVVRLWEAATGREAIAFGGPANWPGFIGFTADSRGILAAGWDGTVRFWESATGRESRRFRTVGTLCISAAPSPDGRLLAVAGEHGIPLYDLTTGKEVRRLPGHRGYTREVAFTPDGKVLASIGQTDSVLRLWDAGTGRQLRAVRTPHGNHPTSLALSADGRLLATGGDFDGLICLWDAASGKQLREWRAPGTGDNPHARGVGVLAFSPDGKLLASSGPDDAVRLWDVATGKPRGGLPDSGQLAFSPDGRTMASSAAGRTIRLWEVATRLERRRFVGHEGTVMRLAFSPDGTALATASLDTTVLVWDVHGPTPGAPSHRAALSNVELSDLWDRLAGADAVRAYDAVCALAAAPCTAVPFLRDRLRPPTAPAPETLARLVQDLDSDRFETRRQAAGELERLEGLARPALRQALAGKPSPELRRRLEQLLDRLDGPVPPPQQLRRLRAVEALELAGSAEARAALHEREDDADTRVGEEAKAALGRLRSREGGK